MTTSSLPHLPDPTPWTLSKNVLDEAGLTGELHLLAPGARHACERPASGDRLVFVAAGSVTIESGRKNYILQPDTTLRLPAGAACAVRNHESTPAKVLVVELPPPRPARGESLVMLRG